MLVDLIIITKLKHGIELTEEETQHVIKKLR